MSESLISKVTRFYNEALRHKSKMEAKKLHKIKLFIWPPYQKEYHICLAVIQCCKELLDFNK